MILAAGRGERARPLTDRIPKPLFPVAGRPLIAYSLGLLKAAGITEVIVNVHHLADQIEEALRPCEKMGLKIVISREQNLLETGGGIAYAQRYLGHRPFIVLNADIVCDIDLAEVVQDHIRSASAATMVVTDSPASEAASAVEWDQTTGRIIDIRGELRRHLPTSRPATFTGIHIVEPTVFEYILPKRESIIDGFYLPALRERRRIHGFLHKGYWADLGTVEHYERVRADLPRQTFKHLEPLPLVSAHEATTG